MILQKLCTNIAWMQHKYCRDIVTNCTKACTVPCRAPAWVGTSRPWSLSARPTGQPFNITIIIITLHPHHCQNVRMAPCCLENMSVPNKWCSFLTANVLQHHPPLLAASDSSPVPPTPITLHSTRSTAVPRTLHNAMWLVAQWSLPDICVCETDKEFCILFVLIQIRWIIAQIWCYVMLPRWLLHMDHLDSSQSLFYFVPQEISQ